MELRQLVYFDAVVRHGGFTRAAELERTTRRIRLTRAGELVLARAPNRAA